MLSWPDFEEKQIVYIESEDIKKLSVKNSNLAVIEDEKIINQISLFKIFAVFLSGNGTFTSSLIKKILANGSSIFFLDINLKTYCVIGGETEGNTLLRQKQYKDDDNLDKAKWLISNKLENQIKLLEKRRDLKDKKNIKFLKESFDKIDKTKTEKELLGVEGNCSKFFFQLYFSKYNWKGRKPRTKFDEINILLDIGYTLLFNFVDSHLRLYGFDLYKGFYHTNFYQRKSLVCDLVEPFRCIIDYSMYRLFALKQFDKKDFEIKKGEYHLKKGCGKKYIKVFLENIMKNKEGIFKYIQSFYRKSIKEEKDFNYFLIK
jgi:CRISPR-associated protein Cas1